MERVNPQTVNEIEKKEERMDLKTTVRFAGLPLEPIVAWKITNNLEPVIESERASERARERERERYELEECGMFEVGVGVQGFEEEGLPGRRRRPAGHFLIDSFWELAVKEIQGRKAGVSSPCF